MISMETIKTIAKGALGSMTFGAYHMYVTKSMMEVNNEMNDELAMDEMKKYWINDGFRIQRSLKHRLEYNICK